MVQQDDYELLHDGAGLLDRSDRGRIQLAGADRRSYLHGLLTNDIVSLSPGQGCYAALLTPQGRMISDMRVSDFDERLLLDLPAATAETVRQRLADFVFSEDVEVADVQPVLAQFGLYGPKAAEVLARVVRRGVEEDEEARRQRLDDMPLLTNARWTLPNPRPAGSDESTDPEAVVSVIRSDDIGIQGYELLVDARSAETLTAALRAAGARDVSPDAADITRVEAGRPEFGADMDEHTIPLEAGIEDRAISLTKGCYVGQEIIIRVLHRGQGRVARRLVGFIAEGDAGPLQRGERLIDGGKEIGAVTSAVISPRLRRPIGLGYVHRDHAEPGKVLQAASADGTTRPVTIVRVPFTRPAD